ncbi:Ig-like domain-containing protein [Spirochaetia bacterium 38H-sp]|uniref:Ig-like domain-containing protein n=1 Tax=Rarispira pelagica TaxID=3141764 RepID=A0ABU9U8T6_9SPIR
MKRNEKNNWGVFFLAFLGLLMLIFSSCNVGLGEQVDIDKPTVALSSHLSGEYVSGQVVLSGTAVDDTGIASIEISFDRGTTFEKVSDVQKKGDQYTWSYTWDTSSLSDGRYYVVLRSFDSANHKYTSDEFVFIVDNQPPVLLVTSPSKGISSFNQSLPFSVHASDYSPISSYGIDVWASANAGDPVSSWEHLSGYPVTQSQSSSPWQYTFDSTPYTTVNRQRYFHFVVWAEDAAGNVSSNFYHTEDITALTGKNLTVEQLSQALAGNPPTDVTSTPSEIQAVAFVYDTDTASASPITFYCDEDGDNPWIEPVTPTATGTAVPTMLPSDVLKLRLRDDDSIDDATIQVMLEKPDTSQASVPFTGSFTQVYGWTSPESVPVGVISVTADTTEGNKNIELKYDMGGVQGNYRIHVQAQDINGTSVSYQYDYSVSAGKPSITLTSYPSYVKNSFTIEGTVSYAAGSVDNVKYSIEYGSTGTYIVQDQLAEYPAAGLGSDGWRINVADLTALDPGVATYEGALAIHVTATAGITAETISKYIIRDASAPTVFITNPVSTDWLVGASYQATGSVSDSPSGVALVEVSTDGSNWSPASLNGSSWYGTINLAVLSEGSNTLYVRAKDNVGNISSPVSVNFGIDQNLPSINETLLGGDVTRGVTFSIGGTVSDSNGLASLVVRQKKDSGAYVDIYTDNGLTGASASWQVDGLPASPETLSDGVFTYQAVVTDIAGKSTSITRMVTIDLTGPTVTINAPPVGALLQGSAYVLSGTAQDVGNVSPVEDVRYWIGDSGLTPPADYTTWNTVTGTSSWSASIDLATVGEGNKELHVIAKDAAQKWGAETVVAFTVDQSTPGISSLSLGSGTQYRSGDFSIDFTATDTNALASVVITENGTEIYNQPLSGTSQAVSVNRTGLTDGTYEYSITVTDVAGRSTTLNRTVLLDTQSPSVEYNIAPPVTSPSDLFNGIVSLSGIITDDNPIAYLYWYVGSVSTVPSYTVNKDSSGLATGLGGLTAGWQEYVAANKKSWNVNVDTRSLSDGTNYVRLLAVDRNGNVGTALYTMEVLQSSDEPVITVTEPASGGYAGLGQVVRGTISDDDAVDISSVEVRYNDGSSWSSWSSANVTGSGKTVSFSYTLPALGADGPKQLEVRASDSITAKISGDSAVSTVTPTLSFTYDATSPVLAVSTPSSNQTFVSSFTASGTVTEQNLDYIRLKVDSGAWQTITAAGSAPNYTWTYDMSSVFSTLADGPHTITVEVADTVGQTSTSQIVFYKDGAGPAVVFTSITEGANTILTSATPAVSGSISDEYSTVSNTIRYRLDGANTDPWNTATVTVSGKTGTWRVDVSGLSDGAHTIDIRATDSLGNTSDVLDVAFRIDRNSPSIVISSPASGTVYGTVGSGNVFTISGTASDALLASVSADLEGNSLSNSGTTTSWSFSVSKTLFDSLAEGSHAITISATDDAGRTSNTIWQFVKDGQSPTVSYSNIQTDGSTVLQNAASTITGSISDTYGISSMESRLEKYNYATTTWSLIEDWTSLGATGNQTVIIWNKDLTPLSLTDGWYRISIRATDLAQNTSNTVTSGPIEFKIDSQIPTLTINALSSSFQNSDFALTGTASDSNTIVSVLIKVDDTDFSTGTTAASSSDNYATWSVTVPTGSLSAGEHTVYVLATDNAGRTSMLSRQFTLDNVAPTISIIEPLSQSRVNGQVEVRGTSSDNNAVQLVEYRIGKAASTWQTSGLSGGLYSWSYTFTDITSYANSTDATEIDPATGNPQSGTNIWALPFNIRVTDVAGNQTTETTYVLWVDPAMDTPTVTVVSPADNEVVGGTVRLSGFANDDDWVNRVEVRIDPTGTGSSYGAWQDATLINSGTQVNWYLNINEDGSLNPAPGDIRQVLVDVRAVDTKDYSTDGVVGDITTLTLRFDSSVPVIENLEIQRSSGEVVSYTTGVRASGTFDIKAIVRDEGGLSSIEYRPEGSTSFTNVLSDSTIVTPPPEITAGNFRPGVKYLITNVGSTDFTAIGASGNTAGITFTATGAGSGTGRAYMAIVPPLVSITELVAGKAYAIFSVGTSNWTTVGASANQVGTPFVASGAGTGTGIAYELLQPSNLVAGTSYTIYEPGTFDWTTVGASSSSAGITFVATGSGAGSGFAFEPAKQSFVYQFDLQIDSTTINSGAYAGTSGFYGLDIRATDNATPSPYMTQQSLNIQIDNYYPGAEYLANANASSSGYNIQGRAWDSGTGSGSIQGIDSIVLYFERNSSMLDLSGNTGGTWTTLTVKDQTQGGATAAISFPANSSTGIWIDNNEIGTDLDGDGYVEGFSDNGIYKEWFATFDTTVFADGPITLHYVVIDRAGNATHYTQNLYIRNNAPVITGVTLGTDLNANGTVGDLTEETSLYTTNYDTSNFKARNNRLQFNVATSGGNGTKYYGIRYITGQTTGVAATTLVQGNVYTIETLGDTDWTLVGASSNTVGVTFVATGAGTGTGTAISYTTTELNSTLSSNVVTITDFTGIPDSASANDRKFIVKVYDSTVNPGAEADQLADVVIVGLTIENTDIIAPTINVADFGNMYSIDQNDANKTLGTVSAYEDNIVTTGSGSSLVKHGYVQYAAASSDSDADISGKVVFLGKVYDNQNISRISVTIPGYDGGNGVGNAFDIATLSGSTLVSANSASIADVAAGTADWAFEVEPSSEYLTIDNGHVLNWKFAWDSSKVSGVAVQNETFIFQVYDAAGNPSASATSVSADIVPYITDVERDTANYNTYRSRHGWYSLRRGDSVTISGFNLFNNTTDTVTFGSSAAVNLPGGATTTSFTVTLPSDATSGAIILTVNGQQAINNINDNTEPYNQEYDYNISGSELWTDDRYVHVWQSDNSTGTTSSGYFTGSDQPVHPAMTIDPVNGLLYASWSYYPSSSAFIAPINGARQSIFSLYDPPEHTDIDFGNRAVVAYNANYYNGNSTYGGMYVWDSQAPSNTYSKYFYAGENMSHDSYLMQFINERVVADGDNIHVSYYDVDTKSLKYQYILSGDASTAEHQWVNLDGGSDGDDTQIVGTGRVSAAGEFSAIDVNPSGYPVIAYYDISRQTVRIARSNSTTPTNANNWQLQDVLATSDSNYQYSGKYISMRIDSAGYLHMVFFRVSTGDLVYLKSTNNPTNGTTAYTFGPSVIIDSNGSVGLWADISLDDNDMPVITYFDSALVNTFDAIKMAYYDPALETLSGDVAGEPDTIDGWETMYAALNYDVDQKRLSIEYDTGNNNSWWAAIGYASSDYYRVAYYIK